MRYLAGWNLLKLFDQRALSAVFEINRICLEETLGGDHHDVRCGAGSHTRYVSVRSAAGIDWEGPFPTHGLMATTQRPPPPPLILAKAKSRRGSQMSVTPLGRYPPIPPTRFLPR
jgi:hypothetical protein